MAIPKKDEKRKINMKALEKRYQQRFSVAKLGKEAFEKGDYTTTIKRYNEYLKILSDLHDVDAYKLTPKHFDRETQLSEMLLLSQVYWELARIYDMSEKMQDHLKTCLAQFLAFTINQPYQVVNAEVVRKLLKKNRVHHKQVFERAYKDIFVKSKSCFIATYCYGLQSQEVVGLQNWKDQISSNYFGISFIRIYYSISSSLCFYLDRMPRVLRLIITNLVLKPLVSLAAKVLSPNSLQGK